MLGEGKFSTDNQLMALREERIDRHKIRGDANNVHIRGLVDILEASECRLIICAKNKGSCLTVRGNKVTATVLVATEFCDILSAPYDVTTPNLKKM